MKQVLLHLNLFRNSVEKQRDMDWANRQNPHSILVPLTGTGDQGPRIKTETHDADVVELLTEEQKRMLMEDYNNIEKFSGIRYLKSYDHLVEHINMIKHFDSDTEVTINLGIATHPETDYLGHELQDWIRKLKRQFPNDFTNFKWRFANTWDIYGHHIDKWKAWFKDSIKEIDNKNILIEIANYGVAKQIEQLLPGADVKFNTVYFKRILRSNIQNGNEKYVINTGRRNKHAMCLNNFNKIHRHEIVAHIQSATYDTIYLSYLSQGLHIQPKRETPVSTIHKWQDTPPLEIVNDSYVNIVTETYFYGFRDYHIEGPQVGKELSAFITEKSFKCAYYYQPMLLLAMQDSLKAWRALGFESFPEFFDESYDDEPDPEKRMEKVKLEITKLNNRPIQELHDLYNHPSMIEKLKHNRQVFNNLVKQDPLMKWSPIQNLYEKGSKYIGLNPLLDEIYLDK